eukprot:s94_g49.t1
MFGMSSERVDLIGMEMLWIHDTPCPFLGGVWGLSLTASDSSVLAGASRDPSDPGSISGELDTVNAVWSAVRTNGLDVQSILRAVEAAVVLGVDSTEILRASRYLMLQRSKELDGPTCLALHEHLSALGVHPENDVMLVLADTITPALYAY